MSFATSHYLLGGSNFRLSMGSQIK